ncbi:hypothetical protein Ahy_A06g028767 [Arachis hypogaea]|uniref:Aminotransferase-like plant mobile domain-containing protein n=1 Tax=Arachis hypogaea TaxID=3818 RepID=A0A445CRM2_ARAHY|nr:hypothetical protein Ahy_A06g028767 [Arachis hypogaea]
MSPPDCIDIFIVNYTWMQWTFSHFPQEENEETVQRWLPYMVRLQDMGSYRWGSAALSWLYKCLCRVANKNVVKLAGPLQLL